MDEKLVELKRVAEGISEHVKERTGKSNIKSGRASRFHSRTLAMQHTNLESLKQEAREKFPESFDERGADVLLADHKELDELITHAYHAGIKAAMEALPEMRSERKGSMETEDYENNSGFNSALREMNSRMNQLLSNEL